MLKTVESLSDYNYSNYSLLYPWCYVLYLRQYLQIEFSSPFWSWFLSPLGSSYYESHIKRRHIFFSAQVLLPLRFLWPAHCVTPRRHWSPSTTLLFQFLFPHELWIEGIFFSPFSSQFSRVWRRWIGIQSIEVSSETSFSVSSSSMSSNFFFNNWNIVYGIWILGPNY